MIDLGDTVTLTWPGYPPSATSATVSITQPDGTVAGPFTVAPTFGVLSYAYPATQAGRHAVRWLCVGPDVEAFADGFEVADADPGFIISLADVKTQLNIKSANSDEELRTWLGAATEVVEHFCGEMVVRSYTESHSGGKSALALYHSPVVTVSAITEFIGTVAYNLTLQPVGQATSAYGYSIDDPEAGIITRRSTSSWPMPFMPGVNNVTVTYTAGRPVIPYAVQAAARLIIQHLWTTRRGAMPLPAASAETSVVPGIEYAVPIKAIELMERYERMGGIA